jgi:hypothetical protein
MAYLLLPLSFIWEPPKADVSAQDFDNKNFNEELRQSASNQTKRTSGLP